LTQRRIQHPPPVRRRAPDHLIVQRSGQHGHAPAEQLAAEGRHPIDLDPPGAGRPVKRHLEHLMSRPLHARPEIRPVLTEPDHLGVTAHPRTPPERDGVDRFEQIALPLCVRPDDHRGSRAEGQIRDRVIAEVSEPEVSQPQCDTPVRAR
jgi:hypothetical protein